MTPRYLRLVQALAFVSGAATTGVVATGCAAADDYDELSEDEVSEDVGEVQQPAKKPQASCGDGECNGGESCDACVDDCGVCPPSCGDGTCDPDEECVYNLDSKLVCADAATICPDDCTVDDCTNADFCFIMGPLAPPELPDGA